MPSLRAASVPTLGIRGNHECQVRFFEIPSISESGAFQKISVVNFKIGKETKMKFFDLGAFQQTMKLLSQDKIIFHMLCLAFIKPHVQPGLKIK